jgi:hypothetical protein
MYQRSTHAQAVKVRVFSLADVLRLHPKVNCIKIDGEGIEAPVVKNQLTPQVCKSVKKAVIEWSFDIHKDVKQFFVTIDHLKTCFAVVHYGGEGVERQLEADSRTESGKFGSSQPRWPAAVIIKCMNPPPAITTAATEPNSDDEPTGSLLRRPQHQQQRKGKVKGKQKQQQEVEYDAFDIYIRFLQVNSHLLLHYNEPHTGGDRFVLVFHRQGKGHGNPSAETLYLPVVDSEEGRYRLRNLLGKLKRHAFPVDRAGLTSDGKRSGKPHDRFGTQDTHAEQQEKQPPYSLPFGKSTGNAMKWPHQNRYHHDLHFDIVAWVDVVCPGLYDPNGTATFDAMYISKNAQCVPHKDANDGYAVLVAIGDWDGGGRFMVQKQEQAMTATATMSGGGGGGSSGGGSKDSAPAPSPAGE